MAELKLSLGLGWGRTKAAWPAGRLLAIPQPSSLAGRVGSAKCKWSAACEGQGCRVPAAWRAGASNSVLIPGCMEHARSHSQRFMPHTSLSHWPASAQAAAWCTPRLWRRAYSSSSSLVAPAQVCCQAETQAMSLGTCGLSGWLKLLPSAEFPFMPGKATPDSSLRRGCRGGM